MIALRIEQGRITKNPQGNIVRYATNAQVMGGFSKLLAYIERNLDVESLYTFSDNCISDGALYSNTGFKAVQNLDPDYMYIHQGVRKHKFGYRLERFKRDPGLLHAEGLTERELALLNGLPRIWDAGKVKWEREVSTERN